MEHYHCPLGCESPQPFVAEDGRRLCGRCAYDDEAETEVVLCTPETCPEEGGLVVVNLEESPLKVSYDRDADVLYICKGSPAAALTEEGDDGLLFRYSISDDSPCGVTVLSFSGWDGLHERLAGRVAAFLQVRREMAERVLAEAC